jgi:hypothetical protein
MTQGRPHELVRSALGHRPLQSLRLLCGLAFEQPRPSRGHDRAVLRCCTQKQARKHLGSSQVFVSIHKEYRSFNRKRRHSCFEGCRGSRRVSVLRTESTDFHRQKRTRASICVNSCVPPTEGTARRGGAIAQALHYPHDFSQCGACCKPGAAQLGVHTRVTCMHVQHSCRFRRAMPRWCAACMLGDRCCLLLHHRSLRRR